MSESSFVMEDNWHQRKSLMLIRKRAYLENCVSPMQMLLGCFFKPPGDEQVPGLYFFLLVIGRPGFSLVPGLPVRGAWVRLVASSSSWFSWAVTGEVDPGAVPSECRTRLTLYPIQPTSGSKPLATSSISMSAEGCLRLPGQSSGPHIGDQVL